MCDPKYLDCLPNQPWSDALVPTVDGFSLGVIVVCLFTIVVAVFAMIRLMRNKGDKK